jgi:hypothetical protein
MGSDDQRTPLSTETPPLLLIRLSPSWTDHVELVEPGYHRSGHGWHEGISADTLTDSMRAWWRLSRRTIEERNVRYAVAVVEGVTKQLVEIQSWVGPRADGRVAFLASPVPSGPLFDLVIGSSGRVIPTPQGAANPIRYWPPLAQAESQAGPSIPRQPHTQPWGPPMLGSHRPPPTFGPGAPER